MKGELDEAQDRKGRNGKALATGVKVVKASTGTSLIGRDLRFADAKRIAPPV